MTPPDPGHSQIPGPTESVVDLRAILLEGPKLDKDTAEVFVQLAAERAADFGRVVDLGNG